jgi:hypothetical protein
MSLWKSGKYKKNWETACGNSAGHTRGHIGSPGWDARRHPTSAVTYTHNNLFKVAAPSLFELLWRESDTRILINSDLSTNATAIATLLSAQPPQTTRLLSNTYLYITVWPHGNLREYATMLTEIHAFHQLHWGKPQKPWLGITIR